MDESKLITVTNTYEKGDANYASPLSHQKAQAEERNGGNPVVIFDAVPSGHLPDGTYTHTSRWMPA